MFSKLKTALRRMAARTRDTHTRHAHATRTRDTHTLLAAFGKALATVTPDDIRHWFGSALRTKSSRPLL